MENIALLTDADNQLNLRFESHDSEIKKLISIIEGLKNADNVLTNSLNDNALRFHVETRTGSFWPENTFITYKTKLTDTHNAMNTETGLFTAPFSGTFGFVFYAELYCDGGYRDLYIHHNGARSKSIYRCVGSSSSDFSGSSIYFALSLKQGDEVGIFSGDAYVKLAYHPAKFTGFLLQKN
jgi:hypothetical protein